MSNHEQCSTTNRKQAIKQFIYDFFNQTNEKFKYV